MSCPALRIGDVSWSEEKRMNHLSNAHDVILGVDTHLEIHMGVLISSTGQWLGDAEG